MKKKYRSVYLDQRRKQLLEDNVKEEATIKRLSKKLGLNRRKPRKSGVEKQPTWLKDSGLDYLLNFAKHEKVPTDKTVNGGVLGESQSLTKTRKTKNIYGQDDNESDGSASSMMDSTRGIEEMDTDSLHELQMVEDVEKGDMAKKLNINRSIESEIDNKDKEKESSANVALTSSSDSDEAVLTLRRSIRRLLNCVSESQMAKTISELVDVFSGRPRATVRQILIEEIDILLGSFPLNKGQSVGWLQQELAACFVSTQARLDHSGEDSRLVPHFAEFFVFSKVPVPVDPSLLVGEDGALSSRCVFIAYLYRFGALTGDLVMDLVEEFFNSDDLLSFQIANQMITPVSTVLRKELHERCSQLVGTIKEKLAMVDPSEFEKVTELEGIMAKLSTKHSREPALSCADHFVKMMRNWNKGIVFPKDSRLPLRLEELRNAKSGKGRWWAVGSAFSGEALGSDSASGAQDARQNASQESASFLSPELLAVATRLGLITPIRQQLFSVLVSTPGGPESTATALVLAAGHSGRGSRAVEHREREMVQIVMHCLVSEQPFNRFYTRVLGSLLNHHRRFSIMIRCAFWDVMAKGELTKDAKNNAGKAVGILASLYDFPLILLKKFNFGDESEANVAFLSAVFIELTNAPFKKTLEKLAYVANNSPKLGRNLRIFMRRLCKNHQDEACRTYLSRIVSDLRDLFP